MATNGSSGQKIGIARPAAPGALSNNQLQDVSFYKSLRSVVSILNQPSAAGSISFGSIDTTKLAPDGGPTVFLQGQLNCKIVRVAPAGSNFGIPEWIAGGGITTVPHGLGRVPIGFWVIRNTQNAQIWDASTPADATNYYFDTTHSNSDTYIIFI